MAEGRREAVLIVDDQLNWRGVFSALLEDEYYEVTSVGSYAKAREALPSQDPPFHLAIVDIRLDDRDETNEDGLRLIEDINRMGEYTNAIVVTGYPTMRTVKKALQGLAVFDYVEKYPAEGEFDHARFRKIVREAVDNAEKQRPRPFVRRGNRVLVLEGDDEWRERLVAILRKDEYEVDGLATTQGLLQKLEVQTCDLLVLNAGFLTPVLTQGRRLLSKIRECEPDVQIIMVTDVEISELVQALQEREILDVVTIRSGRLDEQEFRETVRRSFAFEATKYVCARFEGLGEQQKLRLGQSYVLVLSLQDVQEKEAVSIWLPPSGGKRTRTVLRVSVYAPGMKIRAGKEAYWEIPPLGTPLPLEIEMIPTATGKGTIAIDIEYGRAWLGRLEKDMEVVDAAFA